MGKYTLLSNSQTAHQLPSAKHLYQAALEAVGLCDGDYLILDPFTDEVFLESILEVGGKPIFIDFAPEGTHYDPQLLEDFLSLSTFINAHDKLIYRKDEQVIRTLVLNQNKTKRAAIELIKFIAQRYHLPIIEEFTPYFGQDEKGTDGTISIAQINTATGPAGLMLQRVVSTSLSSLAIEGEKTAPFHPEHGVLINDLSGFQALPRPPIDKTQRLSILQDYTFLSRNKVAQQLLQQEMEKNNKNE